MTVLPPDLAAVLDFKAETLERLSRFPGATHDAAIHWHDLHRLVSHIKVSTATRAAGPTGAVDVGLARAEAALGGTSWLRRIRPLPPPPSRSVSIAVVAGLDDFGEEREALHALVFPALSSYAAGLGVTLSFHDAFHSARDLGTARSTGALEVALDEVGHGGADYVLCLVGARYGHIPAHPLPESMVRRRPWLAFTEGRSAVDLLLAEAVLNAGPAQEGQGAVAQRARAFIYSRSALYVEESIAYGDRDLYEPEGPAEGLQQARLVAALAQSGHPMRSNYPTVQALCEMVMADLSAALSRNHAPPASSVASEGAQHHLFAMDKSRSDIPRQDVSDLFADHFRASPTPGPGAHVVPLVLTGRSGEGKSAIVSALYRASSDRATAPLDYRSSTPTSSSHQTFTFVHFVGVSLASFDPVPLLRRLYAELKGKFGILLPVPAEPRDLIESLYSWLQACVNPTDEHGEPLFTSPCTVTILIDSADHVKRDGIPILGWLPPRLPPGVRVALTCSEGSDAVRVAHDLGWAVAPIPLLGSAEQAGYLQTRLKGYGWDRVPLPPIEAALSDITARPLFLVTVVQSLPDHILPAQGGSGPGQAGSPGSAGSASSSDAAIAYIALTARLPSLEALFDLVFERIEARLQASYGDRGPETLAEIMSLLLLSRAGLTRGELVAGLMAPRTPEGSTLVAEDALRLVAPYLERHGGILFAGNQTVRAVASRLYLGDSEERQRALRRRLANLFQASAVPARTVLEYPWQLLRLGALGELKAFITSPRGFLSLFTDDYKGDLATYWDAVTARYDKMLLVTTAQTLIKNLGEFAPVRPSINLKSSEEPTHVGDVIGAAATRGHPSHHTHSKKILSIFTGRHIHLVLGSVQISTPIPIPLSIGFTAGGAADAGSGPGPSQQRLVVLLPPRDTPYAARGGVGGSGGSGHAFPRDDISGPAVAVSLRHDRDTPRTPREADLGPAGAGANFGAVCLPVCGPAFSRQRLSEDSLGAALGARLALAARRAREIRMAAFISAGDFLLGRGSEAEAMWRQALSIGAEVRLPRPWGGGGGGGSDGDADADAEEMDLEGGGDDEGQDHDGGEGAGALVVSGEGSPEEVMEHPPGSDEPVPPTPITDREHSLYVAALTRLAEARFAAGMPEAAGRLLARAGRANRGWIKRCEQALADRRRARRARQRVERSAQAVDVHGGGRKDAGKDSSLHLSFVSAKNYSDGGDDDGDDGDDDAEDDDAEDDEAEDEEAEILSGMFPSSLLAALRPAEVRASLSRAQELAPRLNFERGLALSQVNPTMALALLERSARTQRDLLGPSHPALIDTQLALSRVLVAVGQHERAEAIVEEVHAVVSRGALDGEERAHPDALKSLLSLASLRERRGDLQGEAAALGKAAAFVARYGGASALPGARVLLRQGANLSRQGRLDEAQGRLLKVIKQLHDIAGPASADGALAKAELAAILLARGRPEEAAQAESLTTEALAATDPSGPEFKRVFEVAAWSAQVNRGTESAAEMVRRQLAQLLSGPSAPARQASAERMRGSLFALEMAAGNREAALEVLSDAVAAAEEALAKAEESGDGAGASRGGLGSMPARRAAVEGLCSALLALADYHIELCDPDEARAVADRVSDAASIIVSQGADVTATRLSYLRARILYSRGDYAGSLATAEAIASDAQASLDLSGPEPHHQANAGGGDFGGGGEPAQASPASAPAEGLAPRLALLRARLLARLGHYDESLSLLAEAEGGANPGTSGPQLTREDSDVGPIDPDTLIAARAWARLGAEALTIRDHAKELADAVQLAASRSHPGSAARLCETLALLHLAEGDPAGAQGWASRGLDMVKLLPKGPRRVLCRTSLLLASGRAETAQQEAHAQPGWSVPSSLVDAYEKRLAMDPSHPSVHEAHIEVLNAELVAGTASYEEIVTSFQEARDALASGAFATAPDHPIFARIDSLIAAAEKSGRRQANNQQRKKK